MFAFATLALTLVAPSIRVERRGGEEREGEAAADERGGARDRGRAERERLGVSVRGQRSRVVRAKSDLTAAPCGVADAADVARRIEFAEARAKGGERGDTMAKDDEDLAPLNL